MTDLENQYRKERREGKVLNPCPDFHITTPYKEKGSEWSLGYHTGEDYGCPVGTPVVAVTWGLVIGAGPGGRPHALGSDYGNVVIIEKHSGDLEYFYAHLSVIRVRVGMSVQPGQVIAHSGWSGHVIPDNPNGGHLHFEARPLNGLFGSDVNPMLVKKGVKHD